MLIRYVREIDVTFMSYWRETFSFKQLSLVLSTHSLFPNKGNGTIYSFGYDHAKCRVGDNLYLHGYI